MQIRVHFCGMMWRILVVVFAEYTQKGGESHIFPPIFLAHAPSLDSTRATVTRGSPCLRPETPESAVNVTARAAAGTIDTVSRQADNPRSRPRRSAARQAGRRPAGPHRRPPARPSSIQAAPAGRSAAGQSSQDRFHRSERGERTVPRTGQRQQPGRGAGLKHRWALWRPHIKRFLPSLLANHGVTIAIALTFAVIVGIGAKFSMVPSVLASVWMVANAAPLKMQGVELGFVPLLPAIAVILGHSRRITKALGDKVSVRGLRVFAALGIGLPMVLTFIAWLMLLDAGRVFDVQAPHLGRALLNTFLVNGLAVAIGMRGRIWRALLMRRHWPTWPVESVRLGRNFLGWMCVAGLLGVVIALIGNWSAARAAYEIAPGFWPGVGMTLLALLYLPNIVIGAAAVLLGGEYNLGFGLFSLFNITNVELPPLPILAAAPNAPIPGGPFLLAIPAIVAVATVYRFVRQRSYVESPVFTGLGAGVAALVFAFIGAWLARGVLGTVGITGPLPWLAAVEAGGWLLLPATVLMWFLARAGATVTEAVPADEVASAEDAEREDAEYEDDDADYDGKDASDDGDVAATDIADDQDVENEDADDGDVAADDAEDEDAASNNVDAAADDVAENAEGEAETVAAEEDEENDETDNADLEDQTDADGENSEIEENEEN